MQFAKVYVLLVALGVVVSACSKKDEGPVQVDGAAALAAARNVNGQYTDNYGGVHVITSNTWTMNGWGTSIFQIEQRDDINGFIIARNDSSNPYDANSYSRFDYRKEGNRNVVFCQTTYNAPTAQAALATTPANFQDLLTTGCGGFPFSVLNFDSLAKAQPSKSSGRSVASERKENLIPRRGPDSIENVPGRNLDQNSRGKRRTR